MSQPGEHKTVQARILDYAEAVGWTIESCAKVENRRAGFPTRLVSENSGQECPRSFISAVEKVLDIAGGQAGTARSGDGGDHGVELADGLAS